MKPALGDVYTGTMNGRERTGRLVAVLRGMESATRPDSPSVWAVLESKAGQHAVDYRSLRKENSP